jgi:hypothetical protein
VSSGYNRPLRYRNSRLFGGVHALPSWDNPYIVMCRIRRWTYGFSIPLLIASHAAATSVVGLSFEELVDHSELIVSGQITRSWSDWDSEHKFIWTHYELSVSNSHKGAAGSTVVVSEPGGVVGIQGMNIAGVVAYQPGDRVLVFLQRMPNGYLRTTGWSQGKYTVDNSGRLHAETSLRGLEVIGVQRGAVSTSAATPLRSLEGMTEAELRARIAARLRLPARTQ